MYRVFNCGIGMVVIVAPADAEMAAAQLRNTGETVFYTLGTVRPAPTMSPDRGDLTLPGRQPGQCGPCVRLR